METVNIQSRHPLARAYFDTHLNDAPLRANPAKKILHFSIRFAVTLLQPRVTLKFYVFRIYVVANETL